MPHLFGYARVSATDQSLATQVENLAHAGYSRIFQEHELKACVTPGSPSYLPPCAQVTR
jgi:hypothetical protein